MSPTSPINYFSHGSNHCVKYTFLIINWYVLKMASTIITPDIAANVGNMRISGELASQVDYHQTKNNVPVYKYRRFTQVSGGTTLALTAATTLSQFNIPGDSVWNLSKSYMVLDTVWAAQAALQNNIFTDSLPIDSIQLQTASGQVLANVQNAQVYTKVSQALSLDLDEYITRPPVFGATAIGTGFPNGPSYGCQSCHAPLTAQTVNLQFTPGIVPIGAGVIDTIAGTDAAGVASSATAVAASGSDVGELTVQKVTSGVIGLNTVVALRYRIPLKAFIGTLLAVDKDLWFGQNLQLVIYWKSINNWGFCDVAAVNGGSVVLQSTSVTNYYLYLAQDINNETANMVKAKVLAGGMEIMIPYTNSSQLSIPANSTVATISTPLVPGAGIVLKRCITVPINSLNIYKMTANNFNVAGVKWTNVQSFIDGRPLQDMQLVVANGDHYNFLYSYLRGSPQGLSQRTFDQNACWIDNFSDCNQSKDIPWEDTKLSGLMVPQAQTYDTTFSIASTASLILAQYQTWLRRLVITPTQINWGI